MRTYSANIHCMIIIDEHQFPTSHENMKIGSSLAVPRVSGYKASV
jgi:hypothetical protein